MSPSGLAAILEVHRARAAADGRDLERQLSAARATPIPRNFSASLSGEGVSLIAEIKRRSPSRGELSPHLRADRLAKAYAAGGATALSVLTDEEFFGGTWDDLVAARASSGLPVLRKDFTLTALDVCDVRINGADAVLLIVAALDDAQLRDLVGLAGELSLAALVETHDEIEIERALGAGAHIVGVNQRDLGDFSVDNGRAARLAASIPEGLLRIAESGVSGPDDVLRAADAGFDAVLVGEHLVTSADPEAAASKLVEAGRRPRAATGEGS